MSLIHMGAALAAVAAVSMSAIPATAQTAYDINRLNAAIQVCNSGLGATPECARLRGQLGGAGGGAGLGGLGGGKAAAAAGIFNLLSQARAQAAPPPAQVPAANPGAIQQAIATCVQNAGGNNAAIQACLQIATAAKAPIGQATFAPAQPMAASAQPPRDPAMATYGAGQSYQACVAADQANWRRCLPLLNGGR